MGRRGQSCLTPSGSKCNEKLLWNYQLRHLKQSFWFASFAMEMQSLVQNNNEEKKGKDPAELGLEHLELFPVQLSCGFKVQSKDLPTLFENKVLVIEIY